MAEEGFELEPTFLIPTLFGHLQKQVQNVCRRNRSLRKPLRSPQSPRLNQKLQGMSLSKSGDRRRGNSPSCFCTGRPYPLPLGCWERKGNNYLRVLLFKGEGVSHTGGKGRVVGHSHTVFCFSTAVACKSIVLPKPTPSNCSETSELCLHSLPSTIQRNEVHPHRSSALQITSARLRAPQPG